MILSHLLSKSIPFACLISAVYGQTFTDCNPLIAKCDPDPALGTRFDWDFSSQGESDKFKVINSAGKIEYNDNGINFIIEKSGDSPTIASNFYIMFGHVEIVAKAAPGIGIVSASVLISDNLDELDWEWLGKDVNEVQTNYFSKGDDSTYNRGGITQVSDTQNEWHTYSIDWTASSTTWSVDGQVVRTLNNPNTGYYPQTPMQVKIGPWSAGDPSNREGTIEWAGGETDYSQGPFTFSVKSISVQDYSTGTAYSYGDHSGLWSSIQASNGVIRTQSEDSTNEEVYVQQVDQNEGTSVSSTQQTSLVYVYTTTIQAVAQPSQTSSSIAASPSSQSSFDNGQYHPNPKYDDGSYKPDLYMMKKSYVNTTSSQTSAVEQSNAGTALPMKSGVILASLTLLTVFATF